MLLVKRCPHTGVVNFFSEDEPFLAVASIARSNADAATEGFAWRCHAPDDSRSGFALDQSAAERQLLNNYATLLAQRPIVEDHRFAAG